MSSDAPVPTFAYVFDVAGVEVEFSCKVADVPRILAWSEGEVILYLGSEGPQLQEGLRQAFGS